MDTNRLGLSGLRAPALSFDALHGIVKETGKTIPQIALNWLLRRRTFANVIVGARNEGQLLETPALSAGN